MIQSPLVILSMFLCSQTSPPSIEEIKVGIEKNYVGYSDFEFIYNVKAKDRDGQFEETRNTYRLHVPEKGRPWQYFVEEIGEEKGIVFPEKGRWFDAPGRSRPAGVDYSFEVVEVNRLKSSDQDEWFPEFPPGTSVSDQLLGKKYYVP